jgi:hypothetical protein
MLHPMSRRARHVTVGTKSSENRFVRERRTPKPNLLRHLGAVGVLTCWFARNIRRNVVTNMVDITVTLR